jgi:hypothetical protein
MAYGDQQHAYMPPVGGMNASGLPPQAQQPLSPGADMQRNRITSALTNIQTPPPAPPGLPEMPAVAAAPPSTASGAQPGMPGMPGMNSISGAPGGVAGAGGIAPLNPQSPLGQAAPGLNPASAFATPPQQTPFAGQLPPALNQPYG